MKNNASDGSRIQTVNRILGGREKLMTKRCQKCYAIIGEGDAGYHEDLSRNNMTACQEDLLYEPFP